MSERGISAIGTAAEDDVADPPPDSASRILSRLELLVEADPTVLTSLCHRSAGWLRRLRWPEAPIADAILALDAAVLNSVQHAYCGPAGNISVRAVLASRCSGWSAVRFTVRDWGQWKIRDPSRPGHGIALMDELSEELFIETGNDGTVVVLTTPIVALT